MRKIKSFIFNDIAPQKHNFSVRNVTPLTPLNTFTTLAILVATLTYSNCYAQNYAPTSVSSGLVCTQTSSRIFECKTGIKTGDTLPPLINIGSTQISSTVITGLTSGTTMPSGTPFVIPPYTASSGGGSFGTTGTTGTTFNQNNLLNTTTNSNNFMGTGGSNGPANSQVRNLQDITFQRSTFLSNTVYALPGGGLGKYYLQATQVSPSVCRSKTRIDSLYVRNIDYKYRFSMINGQTDFVEMMPFESASYKFVAPNNLTENIDNFQLNEATQATHVGFTISVSEQPCDFNPTDFNNIYTNPNSGAVTEMCVQENLNFPDLRFKFTNETGPRNIRDPNGFVCRLTPGKTYYINIKNSNKGGANDDCYDSNIANGRTADKFTVCGGISKFN